MKRLLSAMLALSWVSVAVADQTEDMTDPVEILKKVDAAAKAVKAVSYQASVKGTGELPFPAPMATGTVILVETEGEDTPSKSLIEFTVSRPDSAETRNYVVGSDGENFFLIDHANKTAYEDMDPAVVGQAGRVGRNLVMVEYMHPTPYSDEINGDKQELQGTVKVGDVDCYQIHVLYSGGRGEAIWYFGKADFLPRRVERVFGNGRTDLTLTDVKVAPTTTDETFRLKLPEGYAKSDDFAP